MIAIRPSSTRGHADHGWLKTWHTFSFGTWEDPRYMRFRALRVMNEDRIAPGQGFGTHPHRDMEILTCVLSGALEHRDSLGNGSVLQAGELQRMSAGTGITHSEFNPSPSDPVHLYQIWLFPERRGLEPGYEQRPFPRDERQNQLRLVASPNGDSGSLTIHQDARVHLGALERGTEIFQALTSGRHAWLQVLGGRVTVNGEALQAGDGCSVSDEPGITVRAESDADILFFDLA